MERMDATVTRSRDLLLLLAWAVLSVAVVVAPVVGDSVVRTLVTGGFLLFAPGYALVSVLFPRAGELSLSERAVFGVGASLALVGLAGIPLNATPWGIHLWTVLATQVALVAILVALAVYRRERVTTAARIDPFGSLVGTLRQGWEGRDRVGGGSRVLQAAIALAVLASLGTAVYAVATPLPSERYTELYVLGPDGTVEGLPANATPGEPVRFRVGVANHEHRHVQYGLQVQVTDPAGGTRVVRTLDRGLGHTERLERELRLDLPEDPGRYRVDVLVFRGAPPGTPTTPASAYRQVRIWVTVA